MEIRFFKEEEMEQIQELCNSQMELDTLSKGLLREKTLSDPEYERELNFTAWEKDLPIGFLSGTTRKIISEKVGYIKLFTVHKQYRRKGIGSKLYKKLEGIYIKKGIKKIRIYDVPNNYFMPGIDPRYTPAISFFEAMGFHRFSDTVNMVVDLTSQNFNTFREERELYDKGISIDRAEITNKQEVLNFINTYFPAWVPEISKAFNSSPISLHIASLKGKVMAFSAYNCNNMETGWFGPMGTGTNLRGNGVGSVLLKRCMRDMKISGLTKSTIPWVGPVSFYSYHVNAFVQRVFWRYEKFL